MDCVSGLLESYEFTQEEAAMLIAISDEFYARGVRTRTPQRADDSQDATTERVMLKMCDWGPLSAYD